MQHKYLSAGFQLDVQATVVDERQHGQDGVVALPRVCQSNSNGHGEGRQLVNANKEKIAIARRNLKPKLFYNYSKKSETEMTASVQGNKSKDTKRLK